MPAPPSEPALDSILQSLERLHARLDRLESRMDRTLADTTGAVASVVDTVDGWVERAGPAEVDAMGRSAARLLQRVAEPGTLHALEALLGRVASLERLAAFADTAPETIAAAVDTLDDLALRVAERGAPIHERVETALALAEALLTPDALALARELGPRLPTLRRVLASGVLEPSTLATLEAAARALSETAAAGAAPVGALGALGALRDGDAQRALGFVLSFSRRLGAALPHPTTRLTASRES
jgi:hypothetical protein